MKGGEKKSVFSGKLLGFGFSCNDCLVTDEEVSRLIDDEANEGRGFPQAREASSPPGPVLSGDRTERKHELFKKLYGGEPVNREVILAEIKALGVDPQRLIDETPDGRIFGTDPEATGKRVVMDLSPEEVETIQALRTAPEPLVWS